MIKKIWLLSISVLFFNCAAITNGILESTQNEVNKIDAKEVHLLTLNSKDGLYYITNEYGTFKYSGKNYIKYNNGYVKEKSSFKKGKKHGKWIWYSQSGKRIKNEIWEEGKLISSKNF